MIPTAPHTGIGIDIDIDIDNIRPLMDERLPAELSELCRAVGRIGDSMGMQVYAVGGVLRDLLLDRPLLDVDVVAEGDGIALAERIAADCSGRVVPHKRFRTAIVACPDHRRIDVATARTESYEHPAALPVVRPSAIVHDLYRRDFTINSLAVQLNPREYGRLIDQFGGRRDLSLGIVRVLHDRSFIDDPTRILRAVRFEQRYGFRIDTDTEHLLASAVNSRILQKVSGQRLRDEIILLLKEDDPLAAVLRIEGFDIFAAISPSWCVEERPLRRLFNSIRRTLDWFDPLFPDQKFERWVIYLAALLDRTAPGARLSICERLNCPAQAMAMIDSTVARLQDLEDSLSISGELPPSRIHCILSGVQPELALFAMARSENPGVRRRISLYFDTLRSVRAEVTGDDLRRMGIPAGPAYRRILEGALAFKLDGMATTRDEEIDFCQRLWEQYQSETEESASVQPST